jgi:hypothetical protein
MKRNHVILQIEIDAIKNFLECVDNEAGVEIRNVFARDESGEFEDVDDFENALYDPLMRQEIAARAVYYELNALIERELQRSAWRPWLESAKHRGLKTLNWDNLTPDSIRSLKMIEDLKYPEVVRLIEETYKIRIEDLDGGDTFLKMREMVNAFKHRGGLIDFRKLEPKDIHFFERYKADIEQAYEAIDRAYTFIIALWTATDRTPVIPQDDTILSV